ncbi:cytochrome P450 [Halobellus ruber]|uniref:Cytochrome P450 n=1 Tax=Halobellus ruber TaxID=2761102 RepID=A0A7J9SK58_9EURY|nr:cytochrome P450 [Halobellus ruber]MBB6645401.1 cytochrome P450 [Halobellus ruber]
MTGGDTSTGPDGETDELPPGPDGLPVLGNTHQYLNQPMGFFDELAGYGDVVHCEFPRIDAVAVFHPEQIGEVLLEQGTYERWNFDELKQLLDYEVAPRGLTFTRGEKWKQQRHFLQPMFGLDRLEGFSSAMVSATERLIEGWDDGEEVVINEEFSGLTLSILTNSLFDFDLGEHRQVITEAADELQAMANMSGLSAVEMLLPSWVPTHGNRRYERAMDAFDETVDALIEARRATPGEYDDFLTMMLETEDDHEYTMTDAEVHDHLITFLIAGHETTAMALTFTWLLLATHPDQRDRVSREATAVLDGPPTANDLADLTVTEHVAKEAMRLYPPAGMLFREAVKETTLGGYRVPEGTKLLLPQFTVHTDDRWFDAPEQFRPERFTDARSDGRPEFAYFPFGGGPHQCIGMHFAMMELKHIIPMLARRVEFELLSSPQPETNMWLTLQPSEDVRMRVHKQ